MSSLVGVLYANKHFDCPELMGGDLASKSSKIAAQLWFFLGLVWVFGSNLLFRQDQGTLSYHFSGLGQSIEACRRAFFSCRWRSSRRRKPKKRVARWTRNCGTPGSPPPSLEDNPALPATSRSVALKA